MIVRAPISPYLTWGLVCVLPFCAAFATAEGTRPSREERVLSKVLEVRPAALMDRLAKMKEEVVVLESEVEILRAQAVKIEAERWAVYETLKALESLAASSSGTDQEGGMTLAKAPPPNYLEHVFPIVEQRCMKCHRDDKREGGLSLATFTQAMDGGSSGRVVTPGDPDGSRMLRLVMMIEEPFMPPKGKTLTDDQIMSIREWIESGARKDTDTKVTLAKATEPTAPKEIFIAAIIGDGPPPMPKIALAPVASVNPRALPARAIASSPTAPLVAIGGDRQIALYELDGLSLIGALPFPEGDIYSLTFSLNGELLLAAGGQEGASSAAILWDVRKGERVGSYGRGYDTILAADISPDHRMIALGGPDRIVKVYDTANEELLYDLKTHTDWIYAVKFSPDGELLASADRAGNLLLWQAANGRFVEALKGHTGPIYDLAYTHDSNVLASASHDGKIFYWDTWAYKKIRNFQGHSGETLSVDFNRQNQLVSSGRDGQTKTWDLAGKNVAVYEALGDWAYRARFAKDGALVLSGDWGGRILVWNAASKERMAEFTTNPAAPETKLVVASGQ